MKAQDRRDLIKDGDEIKIRVRVTGYPDQERKCKVKEVTRNAVAVRMEDGRERVVMLKDVIIDEPVAAAPSTPIPSTPLRAVPAALQSLAVVPTAAAPEPAMASMGDVSAWLAMGEQMVRAIDQELSLNRMEMEQIDAQQADLEKQKAQLLENCNELRKRRDTIAKATGGDSARSVTVSR